MPEALDTQMSPTCFLQMRKPTGWGQRTHAWDQCGWELFPSTHWGQNKWHMIGSSSASATRPCATGASCVLYNTQGFSLLSMVPGKHIMQPHCACILKIRLDFYFYLPERQKNKEREALISYLPVHSPNAHTNQKSARSKSQELGTKFGSSMWVH